MHTAELSAQSCADLHWALNLMRGDADLINALRSYVEPAMNSVASFLRDMGLGLPSSAQYQQLAFDHQVGVLQNVSYIVPCGTPHEAHDPIECPRKLQEP